MRAWRQTRIRSSLVFIGILGLVVAACGGGTGAAPTSAATPSAAAAATAVATPALERELVVVTTGGAFEAALRKHFFDPFEKETGVKITTVASSLGDQHAKLKAMVEAGKVEYDVVSNGATAAFQFSNNVIDLDCKRLKNLGQALEGSCAGNTLLRTFGGGVIAYRTDKFPGGGPQTAADFFDTTKFPGPRGMHNAGSPHWALAFALLADGVAPDKLFPLDLDRAFKKLDTIRPQIKVFWKTGDQSQQILRDGEVVMSLMWSGRAVTLKKANVPVEVSWKNAFKDIAYWSIAKNAPHPNAAYAFLDFYLSRPEAHVAFNVENNNSTNNKAAAAQLPAAEKPNLGVSFWDQMIEVDAIPWVQQNAAMVTDRWNKWLAQ